MSDQKAAGLILSLILLSSLFWLFQPFPQLHRFYENHFLLSKDAAAKCIQPHDDFDDVIIGDLDMENSRFFVADWQADSSRFEEGFDVSGIVTSGCKISILTPPQAVKRKRRLDYEAQTYGR